MLHIMLQSEPADPLHRVPGVAIVPSRLTSISGDRCGFNVIGYFKGQFGLGESARTFASALLQAGHPVVVLDADIPLPHRMKDRSFTPLLGSEARHRTTLLFVGPDHVPFIRDRLRAMRRNGGVVVGCWFWELECIPGAWKEALEEVDSVLVCSDFVREAFEKVTDKEVLRVNLPLHQDIPSSGLTRRDFGMPEDAFVFLTSFDFNSFIDRKNPRAVIQAFRKAFPADDNNVFLYVKSSNGFRHPEQQRALVESAGGDTRIAFRDVVMDRSHVRALQECCDAYVSLHRSEGFGLGMAECMSLGKPVIATAWSGNVDFMDAGCAALIGHELVPVGEGQYPDSKGQRWAEPNIDAAATWMARLAGEPDLCRELGIKGQARVTAQLAPNRIAGELQQAFAYRCNPAPHTSLGGFL